MEDARRYIEFEVKMTEAMDDLFLDQPDQEARRLMLRTRLACKRYWEEKGRPVPDKLTWEDPDAPKPKAKAKRRVAK